MKRKEIFWFCNIIEGQNFFPHNDFGIFKGALITTYNFRQYFNKTTQIKILTYCDLKKSIESGRFLGKSIRGS